MDRLAKFFDEDAPLTAEEVRAVTFRLAKGNKAYNEAIVDAYLARAVEVLLSVE